MNMANGKWWMAGLLAVELATYLGCGGGAAAVVQPPPSTPAAIAVAVNASSSALGSNQSSSLTATVTNDSTNAGVTWSMASGSPGTLTALTPLTATYAAGTVTQSGSVTITATSVKDSSKSATAVITLSPTLAVVVTPSTADLGGGASAAFTASVANDTSNAGVTWTLASGAPGTLSQSSATGVTYTAPTPVSSDSSVTLTATSKAEPNVSATSTINLHAESVTLSAAATQTVGPLQTSRLSARIQYGAQGVNWTASAGIVTPIDSGCSSGTNCCPGGTCQAIYTAPATIAANSTATVTATATDNASKTQSASIALTAPATPAWENLVAAANGHSLQALKPYGDLAVGDPTQGQVQPDRLIFHEVGLGTDGKPLATEIWRMDNDSPPTSTSGASAPQWSIPGTLNRTPWNANGSYFELNGSPCIASLMFCADKPTENGADQHNYLYSADGTLVRLITPTDPDPARVQSWRAPQPGLASGGYLPWDRFNPNLLYVASSDDTNYPNGCTGTQTPATASCLLTSALYSVDISQNFQMSKIVNLPTPTIGSPTTGMDTVTNTPIARAIISYPSEDDMIMVLDDNSPTDSTGAADYIPNIYMVDVNPNHAGSGTIKYQYPINFNVTDPSCQTPPGGGPGLNCPPPYPATDEYHFHDIYFQRDVADHFVFNFGPRGSTGEPFFFQASVDGQATNPVTIMYPDPLGTPYLGHPAWSADGSQVAYGGYDTVADSNTALGLGNWVRKIGASGHLFDGTLVGNMSIYDVGHQGWDGYDPNFDVFDGYSTAQDANGNAMWSEMSGTPNDLSGKFRVLVDDGLRNSVATSNGTQPGILFGPVQSPDATKMMFVKNWNLITNSPTDVYLAVDHRPFPPSLAAAGSGSTVTLTITPNTAHPHREVAGYHVYTSSDGTTWTEVIGAGNTAAFHSIPADAVNPVQVTFTLPAATADYAVTAQEYSGLESSALSNQVQVTTAGAVNNAFAAAGATGWDTTAPQPPTNFQVCKMTAPTGSSGAEWKLTWTASSSASLRYYNIYYSGGGVPTLTPGDWQGAQPYLIDSPSQTQTSYIYWQANPNDVPAFGIMAVDRQDQASTPVLVQTSLSAPACQ